LKYNVLELRTFVLKNHVSMYIKLFDKYTLLVGLIVYLLRYTMKIPPIQLHSSRMKTFSTSKLSSYFQEHFQLR